MFAQANSEHCRHKIFNADFVDRRRAAAAVAVPDDPPQHRGAARGGVLSAYKDNAAVIEGTRARPLLPRPRRPASTAPTRAGAHPDEGRDPQPPDRDLAVSRAPPPARAARSATRAPPAGAQAQGGPDRLLRSPTCACRAPCGLGDATTASPTRIASALDIMIDGPLGAAAFNNEFGRPDLCGYFRTFELEVPGPGRAAARCAATTSRSCSPAASATSAPSTCKKREIPAGRADRRAGRPGDADRPGRRRGVVGGLRAPRAEDLDFASVQRDNAEMQRRCQEVIDAAGRWARDNPILSIHDVGAGGLSNALPELVHDSGRGARFELRRIPSDEPGMSPLEIWCNEAQERYVLAHRARATAARSRRSARASAARSRWWATPPTTAGWWSTTPHFGNRPIDMPLAVLLGKPPAHDRDGRRACRRAARPLRRARHRRCARPLPRVLRLPAVADKTFLITIGDRTVGGLVRARPDGRALAGAGGRRRA